MLAEVLQEIELRAERAEQDRLQEERWRLEERRRWEASMERDARGFRLLLPREGPHETSEGVAALSRPR